MRLALSNQNPVFNASSWEPEICAQYRPTSDTAVSSKMDLSNPKRVTSFQSSFPIGQPIKIWIESYLTVVPHYLLQFKVCLFQQVQYDWFIMSHSMSHIYYSEWFIKWVLPKTYFFKYYSKTKKTIKNMTFRMNRVLSRPCLYLRQMRSYRQDMPPPGGYAAVPWRRTIPTRGFGYIGVLISGYLMYRSDFIAHQRYSHWRKHSMVSSPWPHWIEMGPHLTNPW